MIYRLATEEGTALYRRRSATVEPVNGHLKDRTALRRFARRGLAACQAELTFAALVLNIGKFCRLPSAVCRLPSGSGPTLDRSYRLNRGGPPDPPASPRCYATTTGKPVIRRSTRPSISESSRLQ